MSSSDAPSVSVKRSKPQPSYQQLHRKFLNSFEGDIEPVETSTSYRMGIAAVSVLMVLLPLIYILMIIGVGYLVFWHAANNHTMLTASKSGRGGFMLLIAYIAPMFAGAFLILFMLKPLFARSSGDHKFHKLSPEQEPLLFDFVGRICDAVHAPHPTEIVVDTTVNASASFRRGVLSMLTGNDLRLTIGTPLIAGLNTRQFAGVLAHEFGHFSQGAGMRLTFIIRTISYWLTRAVYERDEWDVQLRNWSNSVDIRIGWVFYVTRLFVWIARGVLWCLMWVGNAVSGYMLREMEFDADRHEARLAGSRTFESTARKLAVLNFANQAAQNDLADFYREGRLGDDLAELISANVKAFDKPTLAKIQKFVDSQTTNAFDTHPCDSDRIESANREQQNGIFRVEASSKYLFRNFSQLSKVLTLSYYRELLGKSVTADKLHRTQDLLKRKQQETKAQEAIARAFQGSYASNRSLKIAVRKFEDLDASRKRLVALHQKIAQLAPTQKKLMLAWQSIDDQLFEVSHATNFHKAGFKLAKDTFSKPLHKPPLIKQARLSLTDSKIRHDKKLSAYENLCLERIATALALFGSKEVAGRLENAKSLVREAKRLIKIFNFLNQSVDENRELTITTLFMQLLFESIQDGTDEAGAKKAQRTIAEARKQSLGLRRNLLEIDYPFDHVDKSISIGKFLVEKEPARDDAAGVFEAASAVASELPRLQYRVLARICWIVERLENAAKLPLMPTPKIEEEEEEEGP